MNIMFDVDWFRNKKPIKRKKTVRRTQSEPDISECEPNTENSSKISSKLKTFTKMLFNRVNAPKNIPKDDAPKNVTNSPSTTWMENIW